MLASQGRTRQEEPLRWHWLYIPLVAYAALSIAPSILSSIFFVLIFFAAAFSTVFAIFEAQPRRR